MLSLDFLARKNFQPVAKRWFLAFSRTRLESLVLVPQPGSLPAQTRIASGQLTGSKEPIPIDMDESDDSLFRFDIFSTLERFAKG